ncbi:hypothetical protein T459_08921 [Capsicum annuum]|uniref:Uncharacterized protein n=1 Tax=Capsicum annuum TaxID=4072 RepID=A0A2G2ZXX4_CAPAN|nr:hypothetical protein T459_08921 [Capsicum annuum]
MVFWSILLTKVQTLSSPMAFEEIGYVDNLSVNWFLYYGKAVYYSHLPWDAKASAIKEAPSRTTGKGRELSNDTSFLSSLHSLETFEEVLLMVKNDLLELLSFGYDEKYSFGSDAANFRLEIVRLMSILIFTIHNAIMGSDNP